MRRQWGGTSGGESKTRVTLKSVSTNGSQCASVKLIPATSTKSIDDEKHLKSANQESDSPAKGKPVESGSSNPNPNQAAVSMNFELNQKVVQQDFVDLYMKCMQQFTESLAKMKLSLEMENE
ncbi:uncharacterized protein LOC110898973 [Helianthus annuus]|uniref:uncharacterized protein LOC110898973 n=1 Tax=Helianthus annuus TaxID=4232 RepID=UPI000B8FEC62|nr:uncharacterized protein LOC110898973 [Helianthus annuus]